MITDKRSTNFGISTAETNFNQMEFYGVVANDIKGYLRFGISVTLSISAFFHYLLFLVLEENIQMMEYIETLHWLIMQTTVLSINCCTFLERKSYRKLDILVKGVIHNYKESLTTKQVKILNNNNEFIVKVNKIFKIIILAALVSTMHTVLTSEKWKILYNGYIPFKINSWPRYFMAMTYQCCIAFNVISSTRGFVMFFTAICSHICTHLEVLCLSINDILTNTHSGEPETKDHQIQLKIKKCVQYHVTVNRMFNLFGKCVGLPGGFFVLTIVLMLCTALFMLTGETSIPNLLSFIVLLIPEIGIMVVFSMYGQTITNLSNEVGETAYNIEWYTQSIQIKKDLLMILLGSTKPWELKGAGIFKFSLEGLKEEMQTTYTYYNMLKASS